MVDRRSLIVGAAISAGAFALYFATLAPTVMWGDDAELQRIAVTGAEQADIRSYPLWLSIAQFFVAIPVGDIAWRSNLVSAVFAAIAVYLVFETAQVITRSTVAAALGAMALAVSHTFWLHAVRAEVYSLYLTFLAAILYFLTRWQAQPEDWRPLTAASILTGLALLAHPLILTALPAYLLFIWRVSESRVYRDYSIGSLALIILALSGQSVGIDSPRDRVISTLNGLSELQASHILLWLAFLNYQFLLAVPLGILGLVRLLAMNRAIANLLGLVFLGNVVFVLSFHVADQYAFFLPSYLISSIWVAVGVHNMRDKLPLVRHSVFLGAACLLIVGVPILTYRLAPVLLNEVGIGLLEVRTLPYRDNNTFFLYPPKSGYLGARHFGETLLQDLPPGSAVLADWLPLQTLRYLQEVEGMRPDVQLVQIYAGRGDQVPWLIAQSRSGPVFIVDINRYYDMIEIERHFSVEPWGIIYRLEPLCQRETTASGRGTVPLKNDRHL